MRLCFALFDCSGVLAGCFDQSVNLGDLNCDHVDLETLPGAIGRFRTGPPAGAADAYDAAADRVLQPIQGSEPPENFSLIVNDDVFEAGVGLFGHIGVTANEPRIDDFVPEVVGTRPLADEDDHRLFKTCEGVENFSAASGCIDQQSIGIANVQCSRVLSGAHLFGFRDFQAEFSGIREICDLALDSGEFIFDGIFCLDIAPWPPASGLLALCEVIGQDGQHAEVAGADAHVDCLCGKGLSAKHTAGCCKAECCRGLEEFTPFHLHRVHCSGI